MNSPINLNDMSLKQLLEYFQLSGAPSGQKKPSPQHDNHAKQAHIGGFSCQADVNSELNQLLIRVVQDIE